MRELDRPVMVKSEGEGGRPFFTVKLGFPFIRPLSFLRGGELIYHDKLNP